MSLKVSGSVSATLSERIQWKIPDIFTAAEKEKGWILSPKISSSACNWDVMIHINGQIFLTCTGTETAVQAAAQKTVTCYVGSEKAVFDGVFIMRCSSIWKFTAFFGMGELRRRRSELAPSDTLTITVYVEDTPGLPQADTRRLMGLVNLSSSFEDLFVHRKKTDVTMKVGDKDFPVHKVILMARSSVFSAMFEHDTSEERTGVVKVPDCHPDSFEDFLHHLYTGKFDCVTSSNVHDLYVTADKYDVQPLKSFCVEHMKQNLTVENVLDVLLLVERYEETELLSVAQDFFNRNSAKILSTSYWSTLLEEDSELANRLFSNIKPETEALPAKRRKIEN